MTTEHQEKCHQQVQGKILKAGDVKVLPGEHKRLYQEHVGVVAQDSKARKADEEQEEEILGNRMKLNVSNENLIQKRCRKCFITHFPHHKFCRLETKKTGKKNYDSNSSHLNDNELVRNINEKILSLEGAIKITEKMPNSHINLCESFLQNSCNSSNLPDLGFQAFNSVFHPDNRLKLKGGSRLKIFDTESVEV